MSNKREAQFLIAVGRKGVGKTHETLKNIAAILQGNPRLGIKGRKVLILDTNNEFGNVKNDFKDPSFPEIKAIRLADIKRFTYHPKIEARRVSVFREDGTKMTLNDLAAALKHILDNYQNGTLLIEDINKFVTDAIPGDLIGAIVTQRHVSVDVIMHFQSIGKAGHPKIWANCNLLRMHKKGDRVKRHANKFEEDTEVLMILEKLVDIEYQKGTDEGMRFFAFLDKDKGNKIKGAFTKKMFDAAVVKYMEDNYNSVVKPVLNKVDINTGKKLYTDHSAVVKTLINEYTEMYYGN